MSMLLNFDLTFSGGIWLSVVYIIISFSLNFLIPKHNLSRFTNTPIVTFFSTAYFVLYYIILIFLFFIPFVEIYFLLYAGILVYIVGILMYTAALYFFAISEYHKPVTSGLYKISRHPVYFSFFIIILGASIATANIIVLILNTMHLYFAYRISKKEEIECIGKYGADYTRYQQSVRRFI